MSYSVDSTNFRVTLDAASTELDLSGLTGLVDINNDPIVTTTGGDQGLNTGNQKLYTLHHPYVFRNSGTLTITPDDEQLFIENTEQRDNYQDFLLASGSTTTIAGEYVESYGTYYSVATWLRISRDSNDSYRGQKACVLVHRDASLDWRGGIAMGGATFGVDGGGSSDGAKNISNAFWVGRNTNQFFIASAAQNYTSSNLTVIYNRLVDGRENINAFGNTAINSLIEGGTGQTYENFSGTLEYATWTRSGCIRTFLNSSFGMTLPVSTFTSNRVQQGGVIKVNKSALLKVVDVSRAALDGVQIAVKTYDNNDRIDYKNQETTTTVELDRFTNQTTISNILGTTDLLGEFLFTKQLKEYTNRNNVTFFTYDIGGFTGAFAVGDEINVSHSNRTRKDGEFLYHDVSARRVYFERTRNVALFYSSFESMLNLTQAGEVTFNDIKLDQGLDNAIARFTDGGDDENPVGDVLALKYGKQLTVTQLNYGGLNRLDSTIFMLDDPFITESDPTVVAAYIELGDTNKAYDRVQYYFEQNWAQEEVSICTFSGGFLDFGLNSVVLDGTQSSVHRLPLIKFGTTYILTIGSSRFTGNIKATRVTLANGATTAGTINSGGVITLPLRILSLTGLQTNSEIRVFEAGTTTAIAGIEDSGTTFTDATIDVSSVDIVIHNINYEYIRIAGADTSNDLTLPIQQRFDRSYSNE